MRDHAYDRIPYRAPQMEHRYGPNVHVIADPLALTQLARLCAKGTYQPETNTLLDPRVVRQDHFVMARVLDEASHVTGAKIFGSKIGGDVDDAILLFPDPMGATGGSMCTAIDAYNRDVIGKPRKVIAANLIVTPEFL